MAELSPGIGSDYLVRETGFSYHYNSVVINSYWLSKPIVQRVFDLGEDNKIDILLNSGSIMEAAMARMDVEEAGVSGPTCPAQRNGECHACPGSSYGNGAPWWADESHPPGSIVISINCSKALVSEKLHPSVTPAPVRLGTVTSRGRKGNDEAYAGVRVFDNNCYMQMGRRVTRLAELFVEELKVKESLSADIEIS